MFPSDPNPWYAVKDGDPRAFALYKDHYSYRHYADGRRDDPGYGNRFMIAGPGEKMVLLTTDLKALFVWRKFIDDSGQTGVNCAVFRNTGSMLSSKLILYAEELARNRWPDDRLYTYVHPGKIKSINPGYCFKLAGWRKCGVTKTNGLHILEKFGDSNE